MYLHKCTFKKSTFAGMYYIKWRLSSGVIDNLGLSSSRQNAEDRRSERANLLQRTTVSAATHIATGLDGMLTQCYEWAERGKRSR